jgi:hypothetical protein
MRRDKAKRWRHGSDLLSRSFPGTDLDGLHVFCHHRYRAGEVMRFARHSMGGGIPAVLFCAGEDPWGPRWPSARLAAVFDHGCVDDAQLIELVAAMQASGIRQVFLAATRRRAPVLLGAP